MRDDLEESNSESGCATRTLRNRLFWLLRLLAVAVLLLTLVTALTPQGRTGFRTALFVLQLLEQPLKPQSWISDEPLREVAVYRSPSGSDVADIYRLPDGRSRAAVLLVIGVSPEGLDDPNAVNLGKALARAGFVTMMHWSPGMGLDANISPAEPENIVQAFLYLEKQEYVDRNRVGLGGFCVGASLALVAAADPRIRDRVAFVNAFGPFFDAEELLLQAASRSVVYEGEQASWQPDPLTLRVLANELIETMDDRADAAILTRIYIDGAEATPAELASLSPRGRTAVRLLDGVTPEEAETLYSTLPSGFGENLARISPSTYIEDVQARLLVMHDREDRMVPVTESRRLLDATRDRLDVRYTELSAFDHLLPEAGGLLARLRQGLQLYMHSYHILRIAS